MRLPKRSVPTAITSRWLPSTRNDDMALLTYGQTDHTIIQMAELGECS
jgi:hypothetical protein